MADVLVIMGSDSDWEKTVPCLKILQELEISFDVTVSSAHRTPLRTVELIEKAEKEGARLFICVAGMAAHLAGAVAARTLRPVIGVPVASGALAGVDALYSTVQMPSGFPVATVAIDGAKNAAWLAAQILALGDARLGQRLESAREKMREEVAQGAEKLDLSSL